MADIMTQELSDQNFENIFHAYEQQRLWLLSLVKDPTGSRYHEEKSREQRFGEFQEQLDRTADFLNFAGDPQAQFNSVHVAGTSGKGSVVTMLASILTASGVNTDLSDRAAGGHLYGC